MLPFCSDNNVITKPLVDITEQSAPCENPQTRGSRLSQDGTLMQTQDKNVRTCLDVMYKGLKQSASGDCIGWNNKEKGHYQWLSYTEAIERMKHFGSGLVSIGCSPNNETLVGIYSANNVEWIITQYGCYHYSMTIVPIYETLGSNVCSFIINQGPISYLVTDTVDRVKKLLSQAETTPSLKSIVSMDPIIPEDVKIEAAKKGISIFTVSEIEEKGKSNVSKLVPPKPDNLAMLMYTSGTTGDPKGVMLTHANLVAAASGLLAHIAPYVVLCEETLLSFLPMAHSFEQAAQTALFFAGSRVGFYSGDILKLTDDLKALKPSLLICVPRLLNKIYDKVMAEVESSWFKSRLFAMALKAKEKDAQRFLIKKDTLWDKVVFKKLQQIMGGNLKVLACGSAPLSPAILNFFRCALGCIVVEGYGQTECAGPASLAFPGDYTSEHVGPPIPCNLISITDVPEMGYYVNKGGFGEVLIKGENVFKGYFKDEAKTRETINEEGWLLTGDIGIWLPNGTLRITDRKKNLFKLSQGEYISPEKIEAIYCRSPFVAQCFVDGNSLRNCVVAIVVPDENQLNIWSNGESLGLSLGEACQHPEFKRAVMQSLHSSGKIEGLNSMEQVKDILLQREPFSVENDLLTPTMKLKRAQCRLYFEDQIKKMYDSLDQFSQ